MATSSPPRPWPAELVARGHRIVLMTDARSGGLTSAVFAGHETYVLRGAGIAGRGAWRGAKAAVPRLPRGCIQARALLSRLDASESSLVSAVIPASPRSWGPACCAAAPSIILHEQNAVLGRANRFLSGRATACGALVFLARNAFPRASNADTSLAIPCVRPSLVAGDKAPTSPPPASYASWSLAARWALACSATWSRRRCVCCLQDLRARLSVAQQCRAEDLDRVRAAYAEDGITADLAAFFPDVAANAWTRRIW